MKLDASLICRGSGLCISGLCPDPGPSPSLSPSPEVGVPPSPLLSPRRLIVTAPTSVSPTAASLLPHSWVLGSEVSVYTCGTHAPHASPHTHLVREMVNVIECQGFQGILEERTWVGTLQVQLGSEVLITSGPG